ncbi:acid protease [Peniophora sp. CONT]|nr:acid protease [Peniophora sp. CONT]
MQLTLPFAVLLATIVALYSAPSEVEAAPMAVVRAPSGRITMPLKRVVNRRTDVHPQVLLQQKINHAQRRYARLTGRSEPEPAELKRALQKRVESLESRGIQARGLRMGHAAASMNAPTTTAETVSNKASSSGSGAALSLGDIISAITGSSNAQAGNGKAKAAKGKNGKNGGAAAAGAAAGAGAGAAAGAAGAAAAAGSDLGGQPFPEAALQAATDDTVTPAAGTPGDNSLGLDIEANDVTYLGTVQMGTPPQDFTVIMDTGSADFWVGAENCVTISAQGQSTGQDCGKHTFLGSNGSSSFVDTQKQFQVTYGSGAVVGDIVTDDLTMAGLNIKGHTLGVALGETIQFSGDANADGLMGLAQGTLSNQGVPTPPEALAKAGLIDSTIVSVKLARLDDGNNDGEITFGALDATKFDAASQVTVKNVNTQGFWEADMDDISVDGTSLGLQGRTAILDTGTTLIIAPQTDADTLMAAIPGAKSDGQGGYTVPCTTNVSVAMSFGNTNFAIDSRDLAFLPVSNDLSGDCTAGVSAGQIGGATEWLVGDVFLKNVYASFDTDNNQIQLANLAGAAAASSGSASAAASGAAATATASDAAATASGAAATASGAAATATGKAGKGGKTAATTAAAATETAATASV